MNSDCEIKRSTIALGTFFEVKCLAQQNQFDQTQEIITALFAKIKTLENNLSFFVETSDLNKINDLALTKETLVSFDLAILLKISAWLNQKSNGIFNIIKPHQPHVALNYNLSQKSRKIRFLNDIKIDLGGIAKGYIVDKAVKFLCHNNLSGIVNAGGDIRIFGNYNAPIHIRDPFDFTKNLVLGNFSNCAIASSSISKNSQERGGKSSIFSPGKIIHATVIGTSCTICDALTKVVLINPDIAFTLLEQLSYKTILIDVNQKKFSNF